MPRIVILDANNLIFRSFFGMQPLSTSQGVAVNAVYGMLRSVRGTIQELRPDYIVAVWDSGKKTFRSQLDPGYKSHRPPVAPELKSQFSLVKEALSCVGIPQITAPEGAEGDDMTGTIACKAASMGMESIIVSADKDFFQLCHDPLIRVYSYNVAKKNPAEALVDAAYIRKTYFVEPNQLVHVKALMGEKTDNIIGIKGIGPKTATSLILKHTTIHQLFSYLELNPDDKYHYLHQHKHIAELALKLAIIKTDVEVEEIPIKPVDKIMIDEAKLRNFFSKLEMDSFLGGNFPHWSNLYNYKTTVG